MVYTIHEYGKTSKAIHMEKLVNPGSMIGLNQTIYGRLRNDFGETAAHSVGRRLPQPTVHQCGTMPRRKVSAITISGPSGASTR